MFTFNDKRERVGTRLKLTSILYESRMKERKNELLSLPLENRYNSLLLISGFIWVVLFLEWVIRSFPPLAIILTHGFGL